jgi:ubiquinone/menaquinone biosynthesis C-methylase UbiE
MLNECKKNNPNYKLICSDAKKLPFEDESFDVVMCRNFLQNFEDPSKPFKEMTRVLKKQGICIIVESAVYKEETQYPTIFCRVTEEYHPMFPSHE